MERLLWWVWTYDSIQRVYLWKAVEPEMWAWAFSIGFETCWAWTSQVWGIRMPKVMSGEDIKCLGL